MSPQDPLLLEQPAEHRHTYQITMTSSITFQRRAFPPMKYTSKHSNIVFRSVCLKSFAPCKSGPGVGRLLLILYQ